MAGNTILSDEEDEIEVEEDEREEPEGEDVAPEDREDEDDEEDEEGQDEYEKDGFIVDDIDEDEQDGEEEDRADSDEERQRKKKRKKREAEKNYVLDEDDYELLQDNVGFRRPKVESKKFKRLKKARADADDGQSGFSDEEEYDMTGKGGWSAEDKIKRSLFDDGPPLEDIAEEDQPEEEDGDIGEDEDEMADFIVDEEEVDEHGEPTRRRKVNRKKSRQAPGISSTAIQEAHDIFGDVDELLRQRKSEISRYDERGEGRERKLEDEFEPIILSEKYMTEKDDIIRDIDIPERMQISEESTGPPPTDALSIDDESIWILNQLGTGTVPFFRKEGHELAVDKGDISRFLEFMHVQKLDVPFIAMYRKEDCRSLFEDQEPRDSNPEEKPMLRWHKLLWAILELDRKWLLLQKRKSALQSYYNNRFEQERSIYDETRLHLNQKLFDSITKSLKVAESEREIDDVDAKFNLHFPPADVAVDEGRFERHKNSQFKRPKRKSQYSICSKSGLWEVATKFGYSSEEFGLLISLEEMRTDELEDAKETPEEVASRFTCAMFEDPQAVLRGARHMAAVEISCEPCVRRHVRSIFMDNAVVSTNPTADGNVSIDSRHQFAGIKWLKNKPLTKFNDAQWLLIQKAEEEKLIQVSVKLPSSIHVQLINDAHNYYLSDGVSKSAQLWNEQRKQIINDAFDGLLLPSMAKEARALLTSRAKNWLLMGYGGRLWDKVSVAPYQKKDHDVNSSDDYDVAPRVMACCWGPGKPTTTFVMLDSYGEVIDVLYAGSLSLRGQNANDQQRKKNDQQRVVKFMTDHQPHVAVLGAVNLSCLKLKEDIFEIIFKMVEDNPRDVGHEMDGINIVYGDETLPHLYENSRISSEQLQPQTGIVKRAVALGRYLQNPLAMTATLCGPAKEILSWKLTPLESFLTPDEKYSMVEQIMVDATNQVGLDINLAISHEWLFAPLQFISGLGPRKAASLQRSLVRASSIYTRKDLLNHGLGKKVFVNAVGFLRVRRSGNAASSSQFIDLLDDTRIHPESYSLAQELAKDIYTADDDQDDVNDDDVLEMAIEHVRENPDRLKSLKVDEYAKSKKRENKKDTLIHTKLELIQGFQDWRKPYTEPTQDEEFYMITGETEETLSEGKIVQATVRRVQPQKAICVLDSGLTGLLSKEDYSEDRRDNDLTEKLVEGEILTCKIKSIQKARHQVFLSCKESDLRDDRSQYKKALDPYYHEDRDNFDNEKEKARKAKELAKKHFKPRMIVHPRFQNITADEAMEMLSDKEPGESIIRPSSRGHSYLTLTLKIYDGVYAHKDIIEGGKENKDFTSILRLGKTLKIGDDVFEDLDEVIDRYVDPLVTHLKTMLAYRKFRDGGKAEVDESLRKEKNENPSRIVYSFGISYEHPGTFILTYIRSSNPHHEYVGLYPKGFKFRKKMFEEIDRLVAYFQRHIDDPQDAGPSIRSVAAMVPMRSPATGGSGSWGPSGDRERTSTPGSRTGRSDYRNGGGHDEHPSGLPRPYGGGGGRRRGGRGGRGSYNNRDVSYSGGDSGGSKRSSVQSQTEGSGAGWGSGW
ncbi:transcription elongation factor SPT6 homolog [Bidens hawaiensis]|uniref:transcription elongation factor SPT6 homolog n=1 Tax=Bidens hawaiensis TaxID=980011 RepID=UPI00404B388C